MNPRNPADSLHSDCSRFSCRCSIAALFFLLSSILVGCSSSGYTKVNLPSAASLPSSCTTATVGVSFNCAITANGGKSPFQWTVSGLPNGLTDTVSPDTKTLTISGTPQAQHIAGGHLPQTVVPALTPVGITVTVKDATGQTSTLDFGITVTGSNALSITTSSVPGGTTGVAYSATVTATGGTTPYSWTITGLPTGLTATSATPSATISGTTSSAGTFTITAKVTDSASNSASATFTLTITQAVASLTISSSSLASGTAGTAYSAAITATGGTTPYSWTVTGLPTGLSAASGTPSVTISGTTDDVGTFSLTAKVTDSASNTASATLTLTIAQAATLMISTTTLPNGTQNAAYSQTLNATGGVTPFNWTVSSGTLPSNYSLSATGVLSGTTTQTGTFSFTVKVTDAEAPAQSATQAFSLTINAMSSGLTITTQSPLSGAKQGSSYSAMINASGGTPPYSWSVATGSNLPAGLHFVSSSTNATISGTPTATGTFQFTVDVADSVDNTSSASFLLTVTGSSSFTCPSPVNPSLPLCGTNLFEVAGFPAKGGLTATIFVVLIDNNGNVISGEETRNDSVNGYTTHAITGGNYAMDSSGDGRGVITVIDSTAASATYRFTVFSTANYKPGPVERFDSSGILADGITVIIPSTPVPQIPANTVLGAQFTGATGAGQKVGLLGSFEVGPNGCDGSSGSFNSQSGETIVVNNGGTVTTGLTATGSCSPVDASGIGTAEITLSGGTPFTDNTVHFTYVEYNNSTTPTFAIFLSSDSIGTNQPVMGGLVQANPEAGKITSSLFAGYCGGSFACVARQSGTNGNSESIKALIRFVATSTSGTGGTLSGTYDQNAAGTITANAAWPYTAFTVDTNGVGTFTGSGQKTLHFLYTNGGLYTLDESSHVLTGDFDQQNSVTVENPGSNYVLSGNDAASSSTHFLGVLVPTGTATSGTLPGVADVISNTGSFPDATASGGYTALSATGRSTGTANFTNGSTAISTVIYVARHRRFWVLDMQSNTPYVADVILQ